MAAGTGSPPPGRRLNSWKEIAAFLGRDERTAKRWEISRGLPVKRMPGAGRASVFAYSDEIEAWMRAGSLQAPVEQATERNADTGRPPLHPSRPARAFGLAVAGIAIACLGLLALGGNLLVTRARQNRRPADSVAAESYRIGLHAWQTRTPAGLARALAEFRRAIERDPGYAPAYAGLADAYNLEAEFTSIAPAEAYPRAADAARHAIALDPSLASAHAALAFVNFYWLRDPGAADREFRRALALQPDDATTHHWYATFLMTTGQQARALAEIGRAESLDSESNAIPADKALILFHAGQTGEAIKLLTQLEDEQPGFASVHRYLAVIWLAESRDTDYLRELKLAALARRDATDAALAEAGAKGLAIGGRQGMFRAMFDVERGLYRNGKVSAYTLAVTCAKLGDTQCAFSWLSSSVSRREPDNVALAIDPPFAGLHGDKRFAMLVARAGLNTNRPSGRSM